MMIALAERPTRNGEQQNGKDIFIHGSPGPAAEPPGQDKSDEVERQPPRAE